MITATAIAAGWLGATVAQPPALPEQSLRNSTATQPAEPQTVPRAERLRERLAEPPLPSRGRNPFVYGVRTAPLTRDHQRHGDEAVVPPPMPLAPPAPIFKLSGIASNLEDGVTVLTAIVIDNGSMVFVKAGDKLSNGYSVLRVEEVSVTLADATGVTQTIRLP